MIRYHVLGRKEAREAVELHSVIDGAPQRRSIYPTAIVSISGDEPPPRQLVTMGVPLLGMQFDDVPRDYEGRYRAATREQIERLLTWSSEHVKDGDVIVHCAAGISRSSACALAMIASKVHRPPDDPAGMWANARFCVLDLLSSVHDSQQQGLREDTGIRPNPRIVWLADQILGWNGHLLAAVEDVFAMRTLWADLGESPPADWPGRAQ